MDIKGFLSRYDENIFNRKKEFFDFLKRSGYKDWFVFGFMNYKSQIKEIVEIAQENDIEIIPCTGPGDVTNSHPELAENPKNPIMYCPSNPRTYQILFDLLDEIISIFNPRYIHIGHDEVVEIHRDAKYIKIDQLGYCEKCRKRLPYELFAEDVNKIHQYLAKKGIGTMIWGDQLLNPLDFVGDYDDACYGHLVHPAVDLISKEVVICDWHYDNASEKYPSIDFFLKKGFKVIGCPSVYSDENIINFTQYIKDLDNPNILGMMQTFWGKMTLRKESDGKSKYGYIDDKKNMERITLAGKLFKEF